MVQPALALAIVLSFSIKADSLAVPNNNAAMSNQDPLPEIVQSPALVPNPVSNPVQPNPSNPLSSPIAIGAPSIPGPPGVPVITAPVAALPCTFCTTNNQIPPPTYPQPPMDGQRPIYSQLPNYGQVPSYVPINGQNPMYSQPPVNIQSPIYSKPPIYGQGPMYGQPPINGQRPMYSQPPINIQRPIYNQPPTYQSPMYNQPPNNVQPPINSQPPIVSNPPFSGQPPIDAQGPIYGQPPINVQRPIDSQPFGIQTPTYSTPPFYGQAPIDAQGPFYPPTKGLPPNIPSPWYRNPPKKKPPSPPIGGHRPIVLFFAGIEGSGHHFLYSLWDRLYSSKTVIAFPKEWQCGHQWTTAGIPAMTKVLSVLEAGRPWVLEMRRYPQCTNVAHGKREWSDHPNIAYLVEACENAQVDLRVMYIHRSLDKCLGSTCLSGHFEPCREQSDVLRLNSRFLEEQLNKLEPTMVRCFRYQNKLNMEKSIFETFGEGAFTSALVRELFLESPPEDFIQKEPKWFTIVSSLEGRELAMEGLCQHMTEFTLKSFAELAWSRSYDAW